jgi:hypothetical protein
MVAINGKIRREGDVVHLVAQQLFDLSGDLSGQADRDMFKLPTGRGDEFAHGGGSDPRDKPMPAVHPRDIFMRWHYRRRPSIPNSSHPINPVAASSGRSVFSFFFSERVSFA